MIFPDIPNVLSISTLAWLQLEKWCRSSVYRDGDMYLSMYLSPISWLWYVLRDCRLTWNIQDLVYPLIFSLRNRGSDRDFLALIRDERHVCRGILIWTSRSSPTRQYVQRSIILFDPHPINIRWQGVVSPDQASDIRSCLPGNPFSWDVQALPYLGSSTAFARLWRSRLSKFSYSLSLSAAILTGWGIDRGVRPPGEGLVMTSCTFSIYVYPFRGAASLV